MALLRITRNDFATLFITHKIFQILWGPMLAKSTWFRTCGSHLTAHSQKQKPTKMVGLCFWWSCKLVRYFTYKIQGITGILLA